MSRRNLYLIAAVLVALMVWRRASAAPAGASSGASTQGGAGASGAGSSGGRGTTYTPTPFTVGYALPDYLTNPWGSFTPPSAEPELVTAVQPYQPQPFGVSVI